MSAEIRQRLVDAYQNLERLRRQHNYMGYKYRTGQITKEEWETYVNTQFLPISVALNKLVVSLRERLAKNEEFKLQNINDREIKYPTTVDDDLKRIHYLYCLEQRLREAGVYDEENSELYRRIGRAKTILKWRLRKI
ncbi:MAG: hypothetical protein ACTSPI_17795 [Candidatus Heimdallarchaeaceae archaeon]